MYLFWGFCVGVCIYIRGGEERGGEGSELSELSRYNR